MNRQGFVSYFLFQICFILLGIIGMFFDNYTVLEKLTIDMKSVGGSMIATGIIGLLCFGQQILILNKV